MRSNVRLTSINLFGCALLMAASAAVAQAPVNSTVSIGPTQEDFAAAPPDTPIHFGQAVALDDETAVVGMPAHNGVGRVGVYTLIAGEWQRTATLVPSDPDDHEFGASLDLHADTLVVGAQGEFYVFERRGAARRAIWKQTARVTSRVAGRSLIPPVRYEHGLIAVRALVQDSEGGFLPGEVFLYERDHTNQWRLTARVRASDGSEFDNFGASIALERRTLVVGAPDGRPDEPGAAFVFRRDHHHWIQRQKLLGSDPGPGGQFGREVAIRGRVILVGAPTAETPGGEFERQGNVYVFLPHGRSWFESQRLNSGTEGPMFGSLFGFSIAMGRGLVAVSAPEDLPGQFGSQGNIYAFDWVGRHLTSGRLAHHDQLDTGVDMDFSGRRLIAGVLGPGEPLLPGQVGHVVILEFASDAGAEALAPEPQDAEDPEEATN